MHLRPREDKPQPNETPVRTRSTRPRRKRAPAEVDYKTPSRDGLPTEDTVLVKQDDEISFNIVPKGRRHAIDTDYENVTPAETPYVRKALPSPKKTAQPIEEDIEGVDDIVNALFKKTKDRKRVKLTDKQKFAARQRQEQEAEVSERLALEQELQSVLQTQQNVTKQVQHTRMQELIEERQRSLLAGEERRQKEEAQKRELERQRILDQKIEEETQRVLAEQKLEQERLLAEQKHIEQVTVLQAVMRRYVIQNVFTRDLKQKSRAITKLQSLVRMRPLRKDYVQQLNSVMAIQALVRTSIALRDVKQKRIELESVKTIQNTVRLFFAKQKRRELEAQREQKKQAATRIQSVWRAHVEKKKLTLLRDCVIVLQSLARRKKAEREKRVELDRIRVFQAVARSEATQYATFWMLEEQIDFAETIQAFVRSGFVQRQVEIEKESIVTMQATIRRKFAQRELEFLKTKHDAKIAKKDKRLEDFRETFKRKHDQIEKPWDSDEIEQNRKRMKHLDEKLKTRFGVTESLFGTQDEIEQIEELRKQSRLEQQSAKEKAEETVAKIIHEVDEKYPYLVSTYDELEEEQEIVTQTPRKRVAGLAEPCDADYIGDVSFTPTPKKRNMFTPSKQFAPTFNFFSPARQTPVAKTKGPGLFQKYQQAQQSGTIPNTPSRPIYMPPLTPNTRKETSRKKIQSRQQTPSKPLIATSSSSLSSPSSPFSSPFSTPKSKTTGKRRFAEVEEEENTELAPQRKKVFLGQTFTWKSPAKTSSKLVLTKQVQWKDGYDPELEIEAKELLNEEQDRTSYAYSPRHNYYDGGNLPSIIKLCGVGLKTLGLPPKAGQRKRM
jgi:hypothetical protein